MRAIAIASLTDIVCLDPIPKVDNFRLLSGYCMATKQSLLEWSLDCLLNDVDDAQCLSMAVNNNQWLLIINNGRFLAFHARARSSG